MKVYRKYWHYYRGCHWFIHVVLCRFKQGSSQHVLIAHWAAWRFTFQQSLDISRSPNPWLVAPSGAPEHSILVVPPGAFQKPHHVFFSQSDHLQGLQGSYEPPPSLPPAPDASAWAALQTRPEVHGEVHIHHPEWRAYTHTDRYTYIYIHTGTWMHLSIHPSIYPSILSIHPSIHLSYLSILSILSI